MADLSYNARSPCPARLQKTNTMIPTEPIGSIPRPKALIDGISALGDGTDARLEPLYDAAILETVQQFESTGSPVISDGEQRKYHNFFSYSIEGLECTAPDGFRI